MRPKGIILGIVAALAGGLTLYISLGRGSDLPPLAAPEYDSGSSAAPQLQVATLEEPPRVSVLEPEPEPPESVAPAAQETPAAPPDPVGDRSTWPAEYSEKPLSVLASDEERLREEFKKDIEAEIEKRFKEGKYASYAQGTQPTGETTFGISVGRGDEYTFKIVNLDPRFEPELFVKQSKADWLHEEIRRRKQ